MIRLLLLVAIVAAGWYLYRRLQMPQRGGEAPTAPPGQPAMLKCAHCGVHSPEAGGVRYQTLFFCSPAHLDAYVRSHGNGNG